MTLTFAAPSRVRDVERLRALDDYRILDTAPEALFDDIVDIARQSCDAPVALVSLVDVDRQWFKARAGFEPSETTLDRSVCAHALALDALLVIPDLTRDSRTSSNPLVVGAPHFRFYAGAPLKTPAGHGIGSLCVVDTVARPGGLTPPQAMTLRALARQVMALLELRRAVRQRDEMLALQRLETLRREALVETQAAISLANGDLDTVLDVLVAGVMKAVPAAEGGVIATRDGDCLVFRSARGALAPHVGLRLPVDASLAGTCFRTGQPLICDDIGSDVRAHAATAERVGMRAGLFVPVRRASETIAVLSVQTASYAALSALDLEAAGLFAGAVAAGLAAVGEASARADAARLAAIVEQSIDFVGIVFPDGSINYVNEAGRELVGLADEVAARRTRMIDYFDPSDRPVVIDTVLPNVRRNGSWQGELRFRNFSTGAAIPVFFNMFPVRDAAGEVLGYATVTRDRTEQTRAEAALQEQQRSLRAVLDTIPVGILFAEAPSGRIVGGNRWIEEVFGHAVLKSANAESYDEWVAFHGDGRRVQALEYPLARVMRENLDRAELECMYQRADGSRLWVRITGAPMRGSDGAMVGAVVAIADIDVRRRADEMQRLMNQELSHRMKNLLAVVQGIVRQTIRNATDIDTLQTTLGNRLTVLGTAHDVLLGGVVEQAPIASLIRSGTGVLGDSVKEQLFLEGPDLEIGSRAALPIGLMIHELSTNALKHGALSTPAGRVEVSWSVMVDGADPLFVLNWRESGGPQVREPTRKGFGLRLIERGVAGLVGGRVLIAYPPEGLVCRVEAPMSGMKAAY